MSDMTLLLPRGKTATEQLDTLAHTRLQPCDPRVLAFFDAFSRRVLADHALRAWPELIALAYWFRPAAIAALCERHRALGADCVMRPRGVALHFAPANVDSIFVYSWFLSLLCGNRNIVRISGRDSERRQQLLEILGELLASPEHAVIASATAVVTYPHDDALTAALSARCQLRVAWGGDAAVRHIRAIPLPPLATEIVFPNRQSWAILDAQAVLDAAPATFEALVAGFYNDAFWFAQQACSSPRMLLWLGDAKLVSAAQTRFWSGVQTQLERKGEHSEPAELMSRLNALHLMAAEGQRLHAESLQAWPLRVQVDDIQQACRDEHCGYGLFFEIRRDSLADSTDLFTDADQTVATFGVPRDILRNWLLELPDRAVDRVVPIGEALRFADRWDGQDLLQVFSRQVTLA